MIDQVPNRLTDAQESALRALSRQVMAQLELRRSVAALEAAADERRRYQSQLEDYQQQLEAHLAQIAEQSVTDPLTGLRNRREFLNRLHEEVARSHRYGTPLSLAMIDVDNFKRLNDTFGHPVGDAALKQIGAALTATSRNTDLVARYGGEEFVVILPGTDPNGAFVLGERFRQGVEQASMNQHHLTVSVGVASLDGADADNLVSRADAALYCAKAGGRNRVVTSPAVASHAREKPSAAVDDARSDAELVALGVGHRDPGVGALTALVEDRRPALDQ